MVQVPGKVPGEVAGEVPGGDCPLTVAIKLRLPRAASNTLASASPRCDATEVLSATVLSSLCECLSRNRHDRYFVTHGDRSQQKSSPPPAIGGTREFRPMPSPPRWYVPLQYAGTAPAGLLLVSTRDR